MRILEHDSHTPDQNPLEQLRTQPEKVLTWVLAMRMAMPLVKPTITGRGMNLTAAPRPVAPSRNEQAAGHDGAHQQTIEAIARQDAGDDHDKCAGRTTDLVA